MSNSLVHPRSLLLGLAALISMDSTLCAQRQNLILDSGWHFTKTNPSLTASTDDWEKVTVPHTWNALDVLAGKPEVRTELQSASEAKAEAEARKVAKQQSESFVTKEGYYETRQVTQFGEKDPTTKEGYYRGACWYSRALDIPADWKGKRRVFVRVGAASLVAKTFINKIALGEHRGGFTAFCYELTDYLNYGGRNELRIQVDNSAREDLPPLSADFNFFGGIYRPVELIVTDEVCVSPLDYASPGVYVTTASLDNKQAKVEVLTILSSHNKPEEKGKTGPTVQVTVQTEIKDAAGAVVAKDSTVEELQAETSRSVSCTLAIAEPHRWNGRKDPYLYAVTVSVLNGEKLVDQVTQPLGLRTVAITEEQGFVLNGQAYPVHGVCRHQDLRGKGWAVSAEDEKTDAGLILEMGVTAVRNAHYPQSENWHQIADQTGLLLWDEVSNVNSTRSTRAYWLNSEEQLLEMIYQLYNHPSIAWWGMYNELFNQATPPCNDEIAHLQSLTKGIDSGRIVVAATCKPSNSISEVTDHVGLNTYPGWYSSQNEVDMAGAVNRFAKTFGKRIALSEYGAGANIAHHTEGTPTHPGSTTGPFHPEEWQAYVHERDLAQINASQHLWGSFVWNMFDFSVSERDEGNTPSLNDKGLVTHDRKVKKDAFFIYKADWNSEPMVYIASRRATQRTVPTTEVKVYSNCPQVELSVNGTSCGTVKPDETHIARWPSVKLAPGKNTIHATATIDGKPLVDSCEWILAPGQ